MGVGLGYNELVSDEFRHRLQHAWVGCAVRGRIHCISLYLKDSVGVAANLELLQATAALVKTLRGPWILAGDFNASPQALAATNWPQVLGGTIVAPSAPTCHSSTYDYFVICDSLAPLVSGVQVIQNAGLSPHSPCRLYLRADGRRKMGRRLHKPLNVPGRLPHGPAERPPNYDEVKQLCGTGKLDEAMEHWYRNARREWSSLTGIADDARLHKFVQSPLAGACASQTNGSTSLAVTWRVIANLLHELAKHIEGSSERADHIEHTAVAAESMLSRAKQVIDSLPASLKGDHMPHLQRALGSAREAAASRDARWLRSLGNAARRRADKANSAATSARHAKWKEALGKGQCTTQGRMPSRHAYRWVKGLTGWIPASIGDQTDNEDVPNEDPGVDSQLDCNNLAAENSVKNLQTWAGDRNIGCPLNDQAQVNKEGEMWASIWATQQAYSVQFPQEVDAPLEPLTVDVIRRAASAFAADTGVGCDNIAPRAIARLSDEAIGALADIFHLAEETGQWPAALDLTLVVLIPKADGGRRPIGLFPTPLGYG